MPEGIGIAAAGSLIVGTRFDRAGEDAFGLVPATLLHGIHPLQRCLTGIDDVLLQGAGTEGAAAGGNQQTTTAKDNATQPPDKAAVEGRQSGWVFQGHPCQVKRAQRGTARP